MWYNTNKRSKGELGMYKEMIIEMLDKADERVLKLVYIFLKKLLD